jgi:ADP-ribosyl-[dinitrogen reductase] hydrolase
MNSLLLDRIKGGLYGVAIGDALGGTTEFMSPPEIRVKYGYLTEIIGGGVWQLEPGEVTDDTMMTLCVAEGILENPAEPMDAIGSRFLEWYGTRPKDVGNIIRHTFELYKGNWFEAAFLADMDMGQSGGNGSLMRCLPVSLAYPEPGAMEHVSRMQSRMTHYDPRCDEACAIYSRIAARLLAGEAMDTAVRREAAGTEYAPWLDVLPDYEPNGFVVHTFRWVLHLLLNSSSYAEVVQRAANLGGDSDTIGAIAGGLAGISCGYAELPEKYKQAILLKERLDDTALRLYRLRTSEGR